MSKGDRRIPHFETYGASSQGAAGVTTEVKALLSALTHEIETSHRRHDEALSRIKSRIALLESAPPFPQRTALDGAARRTADARESAGDLWNAGMADDLVRAYEAHDARLVERTPARHRSGVHQEPRTTRAAETRDRRETPLAPRLAEISQRIMRTLSEMRPQSMRIAIEERLDQFQARMGAAVADVARRSDLKGLALIESHVDELRIKLERTQAQLSRLDAIEDQLKTLIAQVSDERLAEVLERDRRLAADLETVALSAAEAVQARYENLGHAVASQAAKIDALTALIGDYIGEQRESERHMSSALAGLNGAVSAEAARYGELKELMEISIGERRTSEEQAMAVLDTLQQALIRILDRVEGVDSGLADGAPKEAPAPDLPHEIAIGPPEPHEESEDPIGPIEPPLHAPEDDPEFEELDQDMDEEEDIDDDGWEGWGEPEPRPMAFAPLPPELSGTAVHTALPRSPEAQRRNLIVDAQRAKLKASRGAGETQPETETTTRLAHEAGTEIESAAPRPDSGTRAFGISARIIAGALALVVAVNGAFLMKSRNAAELSALVPSLERVSEATGAQGETPEYGHDAQDPGTIGEGELPRVGAESLAAEPGTEMPDTPPQAAARPEATPSGGLPEPGSNRPFGQEAVRTTPPALPGVTVEEPPAPPAIGEIARADEDGALAAPSGKQEEAAAVSAAAPLATNGTPPLQSGQSVIAKASAGSADQFDLPPATVGPLSLRLAAANGDPSAEFEVAARLAEGKSTSQDLKEAIRWYQRAASRGFAQAQYRLGTIFERGIGTGADVNRAMVWYRRAAEQGNVKAMHNLAVLSANRDGAEPDYATAARWFTAAAERGLADSQYNLAVLHENGLGVEQSAVHAYKWYSLAASGGDKDALARRDRLKATFTLADIERAEELVATFSVTSSDTLANDARVAGEDWKRRHPGEANG